MVTRTETTLPFQETICRKYSVHCEDESETHPGMDEELIKLLQDSGLWVIYYTEMVAKSYDHYWTWDVSPHKIAFSRELDLVPIIADRENVGGYLDLQRMIELTDLNQVPAT